MMTKIDKYNQAFLQAIEVLNPAQREAVDHIEGPVLVIAGPGTGKTQILAARIGKILTETDVEPGNILCLTYTDIGAIAMRKRLFEFIGPDAYRVNIFTFHSFCNEIIQNDPEKFGRYQLNPVSDLESIELFKTLINNFPPEHPLKRFTGDVYYEIPLLRNLFSVMKKEDLSPEFISQKIDAYIQSIENAEEGSTLYKEFKYSRKFKDKNPGDLKPSFQEELERMNKLRAACFEFNQYQKLMSDKSFYDFDDMIIWVLKAFQNEPDFLSHYQEKYQYILIDEYQDTSKTQNELVSLLLNYWDTPNVFVVGDDDQSIFKFQGANVENILEFEKKYSIDLKRIVLTNNYRSSQKILDLAKALIENNEERLVNRVTGLSKNLEAKKNALEITPQIREYASQHHEFAHITEEIFSLINQGIDTSEIAVIYKEHKQGEALANYFKKKKIAVQAKKKTDILKLPLIHKLINILKYISSETDYPFSGDSILFELLHYDFFNISPIEIARITRLVNDDRKKKYLSIRDYLNKEILLQKQDLFSNSNASDLFTLSEKLEKWIRDSKNLTLQNLFEKIILEARVLKYIMSSPDKTWLMQVLSSFFDFLKEECHRNPHLDISGFLAQIDLLQSNNLGIEITQNIFDEKGVQFLSCHGSKGLEFEYVYMIGCSRDVWEGKRKNNTSFKMPDTIFSEAHHTNEEEELRRLFYVAITRAKSYLNISYALMKNEGKLLEPSTFISEIIAHINLPVEKPAPQEDTLLTYLELQFSEEEKSPKIDLIDPGFIRQFLANYSLSVTHLNNYLDCPFKFYFQNLIAVPAAKSESMEFGSAVHFSLQKLFDRMLDHPEKKFPTTDIFLDDFNWYMDKHRESFTKEEFKRRKEYGAKILPDYHQFYVPLWNKNVLTEKRITHIQVNGVPLKGVVDKIEFINHNQVNVVDYKTGKYDRAKEKLKRPDDKNPNGGDYWRQAVFYKLLIDYDKSNLWEAVSTEFDFIEPVKESYKTEKVSISPEDLEIIKQQIKDVYTKILNLEFDTGCGKSDCYWCNFVKENL